MDWLTLSALLSSHPACTIPFHNEPIFLHFISLQRVTMEMFSRLFPTRKKITGIEETRTEVIFLNDNEAILPRTTDWGWRQFITRFSRCKYSCWKQFILRRKHNFVKLINSNQLLNQHFLNGKAMKANYYSPKQLGAKRCRCLCWWQLIERSTGRSFCVGPESRNTDRPPTADRINMSSRPPAPCLPSNCNKLRRTK